MQTAYSRKQQERDDRHGHHVRQAEEVSFNGCEVLSSPVEGQSEEEHLDWIREAILGYAFDGVELPMTPGAAKAYILVRPVLETNRKKILAGRKAGAVQEKKT